MKPKAPFWACQGIIEVPRYSFTRDDIVYPDEFDAFIAKLPNLLLKALACLLYLTGCRISEALALTWQNIGVSEDPPGLLLSIPTLKKRAKGPVRPRREIVIPASSKYYRLLLDYLQVAPRSNIFPVSRHYVKKAFRATGFPISAHVLRHSRLTLMARQGADITSLLSLHGGEARALMKYTHEKRVIVS